MIMIRMMFNRTLKIHRRFFYDDEIIGSKRSESDRCNNYLSSEAKIVKVK